MAVEVFNRTETKYIFSNEDKEALMSVIGKYMQPDKYNQRGQTYKVCNLYLDTPEDVLIRKSLEKPVYKEKIRLRSYGTAELNDTVFLESKKKVESVVYKRRTALKLVEAYKYFEGVSAGTKGTGTEGTDPSKTEGSVPSVPVQNVQVFKEIDYIVQFYKLVPRVFICYDRLAFFGNDDCDFRLTMDTNIQARRNDLRLETPPSGVPLLQNGKWVVEAKAEKAFPLWFVKFLSSRKIYSSSFSKYGTEYKLYISNKEK